MSVARFLVLLELFACVFAVRAEDELQELELKQAHFKRAARAPSKTASGSKIPGDKMRALADLVGKLPEDAKALVGAVEDANHEEKLVKATGSWGTQAEKVHGEAEELRDKAGKMLNKVVQAHTLMSMQAKGIHVPDGQTTDDELSDYYKVKVFHLKELAKTYGTTGQASMQRASSGAGSALAAAPRPNQPEGGSSNPPPAQNPAQGGPPATANPPQGGHP